MPKSTGKKAGKDKIKYKVARPKAYRERFDTIDDPYGMFTGLRFARGETKEPRILGEQIPVKGQAAPAKEKPADYVGFNENDSADPDDVDDEEMLEIEKLEDIKKRLEDVLMEEHTYHQLRAQALRRQLNDLGIMVPRQTD